MTKEQIKNTVINIYTAINAKDDTTLRRLFAADIIRHATGEIGVEAAIKMMEKAFLANPQTYFIIEDILVDGNKVAIRVAIHGRESSLEKPLPNIFEIFRIENNQAVEIWGAGISPERFPTKS
jgi:predicted ester cyclase